MREWFDMVVVVVIEAEVGVFLSASFSGKICCVLVLMPDDGGGLVITGELILSDLVFDDRDDNFKGSCCLICEGWTLLVLVALKMLPGDVFDTENERFTALVFSSLCGLPVEVRHFSFRLPP